MKKIAKLSLVAALAVDQTMFGTYKNSNKSKKVKSGLPSNTVDKPWVDLNNKKPYSKRG